MGELPQNLPNYVAATPKPDIFLFLSTSPLLLSYL
jgi:hypothetical protein